MQYIRIAKDYVMEHNTLNSLSLQMLKINFDVRI